MFVFNKISGSQIATPVAGKSVLYVDPNGALTVKHPDATSVIVANQKLSTLIDISGVFASGQTPIWDGTYWVPGAPSLQLKPDLTIYSSGQINVQVVLASGYVVNGTSGFITFSGFDQTYDHLEVRGTAQANGAALGCHVNCYFNNDTTNTNYIARRMYNDNSTNGSASAGNEPADVPRIAITHAAQNTELIYGRYNAIHFMIPAYAKVGPRKWAYSVGALATSYESGFMGFQKYGMQWENTAGPAINMIQLRVENANNTFNSGTYFNLIGHKRQWVIMSGQIGVAGINHGLLTP